MATSRSIAPVASTFRKKNSKLSFTVQPRFSSMDSRTANFVRAAAAVALSAFAFWFGTGLHPIWWMTWLAPIPVLIAVPRLKAGSAFIVGFLAHILGNLNEWSYATLLPLGPHLAFITIPAVAFGLAALLFRMASLRRKLWQTWLSFPSAWVAYEYIISWLSPHSTFGNLAYNQMNFLPAIQIASITGIWGISFYLMIFASTVAVAADPNFRTAPQARLVFALALLGIASTIGFGFWRVHHTVREPAITVGLIVADNPYASLPPHSDSIAVFQRYLAEVPALAAQGAKVIVTPEYVENFSASASNDQTATVNQLFSDAARKSNVTIEIGLGRTVDRTSEFNEAHVYSPNGHVAVYIKHHLLPAYESRFTPGKILVLLQTGNAPWGVQICKDADFPALSRQYASNDIGLLLVSAHDFKLDTWLHSRMAILRGVEGGFNMARCAKDGALTLSDDRGAVLAEARSDSAPFTTLVGSVPISHSETLYSRWGDWFGWLSLIVLIGTIITTSRSKT
jgi:apolipoprotein N-acyltransferase